MDYKKAERRFQELESLRDRDALGDQEFRFEVAKLMYQDEHGTFWMLDADDGTWFSNQGEGWEPGDPQAAKALAVAHKRAKGGRWPLRLTLVAAAVVGLGILGILAMQRWPDALSNLVQPTPTPRIQVQVAIASPAEGSQLALEQEIAVEYTLQADMGLQEADHVELLVDGQTVGSQAVRSKLQPGQTSLPLSQSWLPTTPGEHLVQVIVVSALGNSLGEATITLDVVEAPDEVLPEPACTPGATFVADVTIPPGAAFRPDSQMDKVWQVRNSGTCAWGVGYEMLQVSGEELGAPDMVPVPPTAAGESADLAVTFQAPSAAGAYSNSWQLRSPDGTLFGPTLVLSIEVEAQAEESRPPGTPTDVQAAVTDDGKAIRLTWVDQSNNEDAFRVYREDVEASIGLAPANAELFVDNATTCGNTYRYGVVAFNAAGTSPLSEIAEASLPPCAPGDTPPSVVLTVVPTRAVSSTTPITIVFQAADAQGVARVTILGEETGDAALDTGRTFPCDDVVCTGRWPFTPTVEISTTLSFVAIARDTSGQESEPARFQIIVLPPE
jgi:hypothetical protein